MNYRHAYHAGNHTEVFKHSALCLLLDRLREKESPFTVLDTHAGAGLYDLRSAEAQKTGEAKEGAELIFGQQVVSSKRYVSVLHQENPNGLRYYPGSPAIVRALLRSNDRLIACELRPDDSTLLKSWAASDPRISVHRRDAYEAVNALVPPHTRRGLVFIDPPFEQKDEFESLAYLLNAGLKKWKTGIFAAWYPIKDRVGVQQLQKLYNLGNPPTFVCEFLRETLTGEKLVGSGLLICNPPWQFDQQMLKLCEELKPLLGQKSASYSLSWWTNE